MEVDNLEDALDEFDARYLECYNQITDKLASLAIGSNPQLRLHSPLLGPKDGEDVEIPRDLPQLTIHQLPQPTMVPMYYLELDSTNSEISAASAVSCETASITSTTIRNTIGSTVAATSNSGPRTASAIGANERSYECFAASRMGEYPTSVGFGPSCESSRASSYNSLIHGEIGGDQAVNPPTMYRSYSLTLDSLRCLHAAADTIMSHPLRVHRLLLTLLIIPKLAGRRGERRNTVATYVGNPFYRGRLSPQRKASVSSTARNAIGPYVRTTTTASLAGSKGCTFELGEVALARRGRSDLEESAYR